MARIYYSTKVSTSSSRVRNASHLFGSRSSEAEIYAYAAGTPQQSAMSTSAKSEYHPDCSKVRTLLTRGCKHTKHLCLYQVDT
jgi:hypothetical protein